MVVEVSAGDFSPWSLLVLTMCSDCKRSLLDALGSEKVVNASQKTYYFCIIWIIVNGTNRA